MLSCEEATRLMSDAMERPLPVKDRLSLNVHLVMCKGCRNFGHQVQGLRQVAREYVKRSEDDSRDS
ncbi:MAG: zf-HC2 domain-containing protein [Gammaproteobacteria bacterium]